MHTVGKLCKVMIIPSTKYNAELEMIQKGATKDMIFNSVKKRIKVFSFLKVGLKKKNDKWKGQIRFGKY